MKTETAEYYHLDPDDGLTLNLGINPLLQFGLKETREQLCMNILNDLSAVHFTFEINDEIIGIHQSEETWHSGRHSILLYYPIEKLIVNYWNIFNVYMRVSGSLVMGETGDCLAGIMGQSMGAGEAWDGEIRVTDKAGTLKMILTFCRRFAIMNIEKGTSAIAVSPQIESQKSDRSLSDLSGHFFVR